MTVTSALNRLQLDTPIIQAPMGGGPSTAELVAAVSAAGGMGSLGAAYLQPQQIDEAIRTVRARTDRPFAVNLFVGGFEEAGRAFDPRPMLDLLAPLHAELGIEPPVVPALMADPYEAQLEAILDARPPVFSFTFGIPPARDLARARDAGMVTIGTATTVREAQRLEAAGVDAILAQGGEAGGHRGTFDGPFAAALIPVRRLVADIVAAVETPVIGAGGLMTGADVAEVLGLGAAAAALGTAFLATPESGVSPAQRDAILGAEGDPTLVTRAFSGRPARAIANVFTALVARIEASILPYPRQNQLTRPLRTAAAGAGDARYLSMYAGTGVARVRAVAAAALVRELADEAEAAALAGPGPGSRSQPAR